MPVWRRVITQQGATFTWEVPIKAGSTYEFDSFAQPTKVTRSSTAAP